jgi:hypothetical protein
MSIDHFVCVPFRFHRTLFVIPEGNLRLGIPQGLKPALIAGLEAKAGALAYLEAKVSPSRN